MRSGYLDTAMRLGGAREPVASWEEVVIDGRVPARAYRPLRPVVRAGCLLWLHGGGWVMGDLDGFDHVGRALANACGHVVVSVDYRLAPEHPFPAAVDDARAAVIWATGHGARQLDFDPKRVVVGGDSAGGTLAAVAARHHADTLAGQALVYPAVDAAMATDSYARFADGPMLRADEMASCFEAYLGGADPTHPDVSPLLAESLAGLPPAMVVLAGFDPLHDDGAAYAAALRAAGVEVELALFDDMVHGFLRWGGAVDCAQTAIRTLGGWTRQRIGG